MLACRRYQSRARRSPGLDATGALPPSAWIRGDSRQESGFVQVPVRQPFKAGTGNRISCQELAGKRRGGLASVGHGETSPVGPPPQIKPQWKFDFLGYSEKSGPQEKPNKHIYLCRWLLIKGEQKFVSVARGFWTTKPSTLQPFGVGWGWKTSDGEPSSRPGMWRVESRGCSTGWIFAEL